jgi:microcompartment protein CcmL/EutN
MKSHEAIGLVELSSIGIGYETQDAMLKAADVELLVARTICSGKFLIVVAGEVSSVQSSVREGVEKARGVLIEHLVIPHVHKDIFPAIAGAVALEEEDMGALGILETFSVASVIEAADAAAKTSDAKLFRLHLAMAVGGKGFLLLTGDLSSVKASVEVATETAAERGMVVSKVVIPSPRKELFKEYI